MLCTSYKNAWNTPEDSPEKQALGRARSAVMMDNDVISGIKYDKGKRKANDEDEAEK